MPTYTYACKKCDETVDIFHGINAKPRVKCEVCGGSSRRLIGKGSGIIFKGSGFYETDYKRKGSRRDPAETAAKGDGAKGESAAKSDSTGKSDAVLKNGDSSKSGSSSKSEATSAATADSESNH